MRGLLRARRALLLLVACLAPHPSPLTPAVWAANPRLSGDYEAMMEWLSAESAEGLAFHSAVSFDPPLELKPGGVGLDLTMGLGTIPLHKNTFPKLQVKTLQDIHPEENFEDTTLFPDMTAHIRFGLPDRWDAALRLSNASIPRRKISPTTEGQGQSNIAGGQIRKHLGDPRLERVTVYATYDYLWGGFKFFNSFSNIPVTDTLSLDSDNEGILAWSIKTYGAGMTVSHEWGRWVPYYGVGYHYSHGAIRTRLTSRFDTPLVSPVVGEGRHIVKGSQQLRGTLGTLVHGNGVDWYAATELLVFGSRAGRAFAVHIGLAVPVRTPRWAGVEKDPGDLRDGLPQRLGPAGQDLRDAPRALEVDEMPPSMIILR